jgi:23S rRNA pseudouridine2605 synthase
VPEERIQKLLAEAGVASRRASESLIAAGRVRIDGRVARLGEKADAATARIEVDGQPVGIGVAKTYLALHKPMGVTSTTRDRHADRTVLDLVPTALVPDGTRLYPVGRLDLDSEGLILLTNDGEWAERVLHPRFGVEREYAIGVRIALSAEQIEAINAGIALDEGMAVLARPLRRMSRTEIGALRMAMDPPPDPALRWLAASLRQGWKRQLRRMFGAVAVPIDRLVRIRIGPVPLGELRTGSVRRLKTPEIAGIVGEGRGQAGRPSRGGPARSPGPGPSRPSRTSRDAGSSRPSRTSRDAGSSRPSRPSRPPRPSRHDET